MSPWNPTKPCLRPKQQSAKPRSVVKSFVESRAETGMLATHQLGSSMVDGESQTAMEKC